MAIDANFMIGGEAGQGVQSIGATLSKVFARGGYNVFADQDYESRIRGGHSFFRVRVKDEPVRAIAEPVDVLVALNKETIDIHLREVKESGIVIYDGEKIKDAGSDRRLFGVPLSRIAVEKGGNPIMENTVALSAALGMVGFELETLNRALREQFKSGEIGEANARAASGGYSYVKENYKGDFSLRIGMDGQQKGLLLNGSDAIALGAIAAGCKFLAGYPMTPSTPILEYMAAKADEFGLAVVQSEDEIAAIIMAIGAAFAGVRAMTATSGSGFCLMVEGLGLAGITETPVVIVDGQRPGPAVGLPTRTEQGDLKFVINAHHGDFPRAVLAPATIDDGFWLTVKAFNLAEKYQIPVFVLTDHFIATAYNTVSEFDISRVTIERGALYQDGDGEKPYEYKRHRVTDSGISPRAFPGQKNIVVVTDSDEHDEAGHLIEDAETRQAQMDKRMRKLAGLKSEIAPPEIYGPENAEITLIGWGGTYGALREAADILNREGKSANLLHFREIWPFPAEAVSSFLAHTQNTCVVENNATGQLAYLIRAETGKLVDAKILKYDGRPFSPAYIVKAVKELPLRQKARSR